MISDIQIDIFRDCFVFLPEVTSTCFCLVKLGKLEVRSKYCMITQ